MPRLKTTTKLSVIITLHNEGDELKNTFDSLFNHTAKGALEVIVIDDASNDGYDYKIVCSFYDVIYVKNPIRLGVASSRNIGVEMASCLYVMLLDAHMRFYQSDWLSRLLKHLEEDSRRLICTQTVVLRKNEKNQILQHDEDHLSYGAYVNFIELDRLFEPRWCFYKHQGILSLAHPYKIRPQEIPLLCILGATYTFSKEIWQKLGGVYGLREYGLDEPYLSIKAWLSGVIPVMIEDVYIGHIYRNRAPYAISKQSQLYNSLFLSLLFLPCPYIKGYLSAKSFTDEDILVSILFEFYNNLDWIKRERNIYLSKGGKSIEQIIDMNTRAFLIECGRQDTASQLESITSRIISNYHNIGELGLLSGRLGCILYLLIYARVKQSSIIQQIAETYSTQTIKEILNMIKSNEVLLFEMGWFLVYVNTYHLLDIDMEKFIELIDDVLLNNILKDQLSDNITLRDAIGLYLECRLFIEKEKPISLDLRGYIAHFISEYQSIRTFFFYLINIEDFIEVKPSLFDISYFYTPSPLDITKYTLGLDGLAGVGISELRFFEYETIGNYSKKFSYEL
ncbi:glycosyltransferase family 2 protein [Porphyromonas pogonae]|uniref:glycosyltransferase family 2 protein n=1 Tax=Porphyromonas pogonae TaxID=867595 RepID=UPI002E79C8EA|nr:glycosyltransferase [Porphyromonas pogonae]